MVIDLMWQLEDRTMRKRRVLVNREVRSMDMIKWLLDVEWWPSLHETFDAVDEHANETMRQQWRPEGVYKIMLQPHRIAFAVDLRIVKWMGWVEQ